MRDQAKSGPSENDQRGRTHSATASLARLQAQARHARHEAQALADAVAGILDELSTLVCTEVRAKPHLALSAAAGIGYVLGGGIPTPVGRLLLDQGLRVAVTVALARLAAGPAPTGKE